ncbi:Rha family transcriptional regulator [Geobacillus sp. Y412MC52]|uniref:Rha family transcriptional regulator n=1 Tax=Geobacillus sp. (strain Y412MC52) TaxID=550542 RepID=UPI00018C180D|nr:Rha family transcriptional regulator [Geobacillus sp. Y412MC52]ADU95324.1 phage regulatory protein, Rha family [Geobacillus sp. Y412MC52]
MSDLVFIQNDEVLTDSLTVAEMFGKEHKNVKRDIENTINNIDVLKTSEEARELGIDFSSLKFERCEYKAANGQIYTKFLLNFDAFMLVTMGYTTQRAMLVKVRYINEFNRMKEALQKQQQVLQPKTQAEMLLLYAQQMVEQERKIKALEEDNARQNSRIEQLENKIEKRMTEEFEMQLVTPTQIGKMFEPALSGKEVNKLLQKAGLQWRVGGEWVATVEGKKYSSSEPIQLESGKMVYQLKWQRRVKDIIQAEMEVTVK